MQDLFFYIFAGLTLLFGFLVVANPFSRNPVTSVMFLVLSIGSMAGLFVLLHAFFLAAVQVVVYAGAVMVLFLFVIMLLDLKEEQRRHFKTFGLVGGGVAVLALAAVIGRAILQFPQVTTASPAMVEGGAKTLGKLLFSDFLLPFEIMSILLLVAMVGVILLSKKDLR